jgi:hypothetical protein
LAREPIWEGSRSPHPPYLFAEESLCPFRFRVAERSPLALRFRLTALESAPLSEFARPPL